jgi:hypothetical protein
MKQGNEEKDRKMLVILGFLRERFNQSTNSHSLIQKMIHTDKEGT